MRSWGGENVFLYILLEALHFRAANPCLTLQAVHVHCELPSTFGARALGDQRLGKKLVATRVQEKMRRMGMTLTMTPQQIGTLTLNVTELRRSF
mmetsp:Transcript_13646/g.31365  ORF Transcript_13646/g.31365 Transcript_13646/m.31365 type:complete len:94 (+) Transcript_13646:609-890(+)